MGSSAGAWDCMPDATIMSEVERLLRETKKLEEEQEMFLMEKQQLDIQNRLLLMKKQELEAQVNNVASESVHNSSKLNC